MRSFSRSSKKANRVGSGSDLPTREGVEGLLSKLDLEQSQLEQRMRELLNIETPTQADNEQYVNLKGMHDAVLSRKAALHGSLRNLAEEVRQASAVHENVELARATRDSGRLNTARTTVDQIAERSLQRALSESEELERQQRREEQETLAYVRTASMRDARGPRPSDAILESEIEAATQQSVRESRELERRCSQEAEELLRAQEASLRTADAPPPPHPTNDELEQALRQSQLTAQEAARAAAAREADEMHRAEEASLREASQREESLREEEDDDELRRARSMSLEASAAAEAAAARRRQEEAELEAALRASAAESEAGAASQRGAAQQREEEAALREALQASLRCAAEGSAALLPSSLPNAAQLHCGGPSTAAGFPAAFSGAGSAPPAPPLQQPAFVPADDEVDLGELHAVDLDDRYAQNYEQAAPPRRVAAPQVATATRPAPTAGSQRLQPQQPSASHVSVDDEVDLADLSVAQY